MTRNRLLTLSLLVILIWLHGCGFQLRGSSSIPLEVGDSIYLADSSGDVAREVRQQLEMTGISFSREATGADYIMRVSQERFERMVVSVSPRTGRAEEYELTLSAHLSINRGDGKTLVDNERVSAARDYLFDETAVVSGFEEERLIRQELARQVAYQILLRLQAVTTRDATTAAAQ